MTDVSRALLLREKSPVEMLVEIVIRLFEPQSGTFCSDYLAYFASYYQIIWRPFSSGLNIPPVETAVPSEGRHPIRIIGKQVSGQLFYPLEFLIMQRVDEDNPELDKKWELPGGKVEYRDAPTKEYPSIRLIAALWELHQEAGVSLIPEYQNRKKRPFLRKKINDIQLYFYDFLYPFCRFNVTTSHEHSLYSWVDIAQFESMKQQGRITGHTLEIWQEIRKKYNEYLLCMNENLRELSGNIDKFVGFYSSLKDDTVQLIVYPKHPSDQGQGLLHRDHNALNIFREEFKLSL